jgi:hypothetical protein
VCWSTSRDVRRAGPTKARPTGCSSYPSGRREVDVYGGPGWHARPVKRPLAGHDWHDIVGQLLEMAEGVYAVVAFALFGALVGTGAALLNARYWIGLSVGAVLVPVAVVLLARAAGREADH